MCSGWRRSHHAGPVHAVRKCSVIEYCEVVGRAIVPDEVAGRPVMAVMKGRILQMRRQILLQVLALLLLHIFDFCRMPLGHIKERTARNGVRADHRMQNIG